MQRVFDHIDKHGSEYVKDLQALLRQPSMSARGEGIDEAAGMVEGMLKDLGGQVQVIRPEGALPLIYGEIPGETDRVLMFYNHYDVWPPEPLDRWSRDPFGAEIDAGTIYARGASDNKGDLVARIKAVEAFLKVRGRPPGTVKFIVEGENEIGSPNLARITEGHAGLFRGDGCIWETGSCDHEGRPELTLGCKGMCYAEVEVGGLRTDLHSALAAIVPSPAWRLVWAVGSLKNAKEEVLIPGFYDGVRPPSPEENQLLEGILASPELLAHKFGVDYLALGISGKEALRRLCFEPTCNIAGLAAGYEGPGSETVLPGRAVAKIDIRLVPDQDPRDIAKKFEDYLKASGHADFKATWLDCRHPARTDPGADIVKAVRKAAAELYQKEPSVYPSSAGTGPMHQVASQFGTPAVGMGIGNPRSQGHGPDENVRVRDFLNGIKCVALVMERFAG